MSTDTGLLHAYVLDGKGGGTALADWDAVTRWSGDGCLWVSLDYAAADSARWLAEHSRIDALMCEALLDTDPRPRAITHGNGVLAIFRGVNLNRGAEPEDMISIRCWIERARVITMRHRISRSLKMLAADVETGRGPRDAAELTVHLADRIVDGVVARVDDLGDSIALLEEQVLADARKADLRSRIADHRRRAIALRRFLGPQRDALAKLHQVSIPWMEASHREAVAEVADRMTRTVEELDAVRDRASVTQEELASQLAEQTNQRLYVLSLITAVFLPLGFVCSLLGVNVGGVPFQHEDTAFWVLCGAFGVGVLCQLWFFRRRGWF